MKKENNFGFNENKLTKKLIEDAFEGGFEYRGVGKRNNAVVQQASMDDDWFIFSKDIDGMNPYRVVTERLLLDPKLWEAVNKTRKKQIHHRYSMVAFVNALATVGGYEFDKALEKMHEKTNQNKP